MGAPRSVTVVLTRQLERILDRYVLPRAHFGVHPGAVNECVLRETSKESGSRDPDLQNASWTSGLLIYDMQAL